MTIEASVPKRQRAAAFACAAVLAMTTGPALAAGTCPAREETFSSRLPADVMTQIGGGSAFPAGAGTLNEPKVLKAGVLFHKIRDSGGEAIGIASQMERALVTDQGVTVQHTSWTVLIPTRGALFLQEIEDVTQVRQAVERMKADPSLPSVDIQTTIGPRSDRRGVIVGGAGEFEGCTGSFVEVESIQKVDPASAVAVGIVGGVQLRVRFGS